MRVYCDLDNMSSTVSGVVFTRTPDGKGWVSEDLLPALANAFATIPGYSLYPEVEAEPTAKKGNRNG